VAADPSITRLHNRSDSPARSELRESSSGSGVKNANPVVRPDDDALMREGVEEPDGVGHVVSEMQDEAMAKMNDVLGPVGVDGGVVEPEDTGGEGKNQDRKAR
jgi:hypothetical protein